MDRSYAEDEVALRREEALQGHRARQAPRAPCDDEPHPRQEERQASAASGRGPRRLGRRSAARQGAARAMSRVKRSGQARKKRRATLARTKGYRGEAHKSYKRAKEALLKADTYAYRDRRNRKRDFRRLPDPREGKTLDLGAPETAPFFVPAPPMITSPDNDKLKTIRRLAEVRHR